MYEARPARCGYHPPILIDAIPASSADRMNCRGTTCPSNPKTPTSMKRSRVWLAVADDRRDRLRLRSDQDWAGSRADGGMVAVRRFGTASHQRRGSHRRRAKAAPSTTSRQSPSANVVWVGIASTRNYYSPANECEAYRSTRRLWSLASNVLLEKAQVFEAVFLEAGVGSPYVAGPARAASTN
jgi:hypothetical protein